MAITSTFSSFIIYVSVAVAIYYVAFIYKKRRFFQFAWHQKGFFLPVFPVIGNCYVLLFSIFDPGLPFSIISATNWIKKYIGHPFNFWLGNSYHCILSNPKEIKVILNHPKCSSKGYIGKEIGHLNIGSRTSIGFVQYEAWKPKRKIFQNSFKSSVLKSYVPTFYQQSCKLLSNISTLSENDDLFQILNNYSFDVFFLTSAGFKEEDNRPEFKKIGALTIRFQQQVGSTLINPLLPVSIWLKFFPAGKKLSNEIKEVRNVLSNFLEEKRNRSNKTEDSADNENAMPLFDLMVNVASKKMTDEDLLDEINFFTFAAVDTSANVLAFCFTLLGMHPEIQETVYTEVIDQLSSREILYDDLSKLTYTEAVVLETLRLFPPAPFSMRSAMDDIDLGTNVVPKGTNFIIDIFNTHRDEEYWPNPLKFDPTRFLPENASKIQPYTFLAFSAGPRDCLGRSQAMALIKITLANTIRKFRITSKYKSVDEIILSCLITISTLHPIDCHFIPRSIE